MSVRIEESQSLQLPAHGYVRAKPLARYLGASEGTMWKWVAEGRMPAPVKFAPKFTAWPCEKIHEWLAERGAA